MISKKLLLLMALILTRTGVCGTSVSESINFSIGNMEKRTLDVFAGKHDPEAKRAYIEPSASGPSYRLKLVYNDRDPRYREFICPPKDSIRRIIYVNGVPEEAEITYECTVWGKTTTHDFKGGGDMYKQDENDGLMRQIDFNIFLKYNGRTIYPGGDMPIDILKARSYRVDELKLATPFLYNYEQSIPYSLSRETHAKFYMTIPDAIEAPVEQKFSISYDLHWLATGSVSNAFMNALNNGNIKAQFIQRDSNLKLWAQTQNAYESITPNTMYEVPVKIGKGDWTFYVEKPSTYGSISSSVTFTVSVL